MMFVGCQLLDNVFRNPVFLSAIDFDILDGEIEEVGAVVNGNCNDSSVSIAEDC